MGLMSVEGWHQACGWAEGIVAIHLRSMVAGRALSLASQLLQGICGLAGIWGQPGISGLSRGERRLLTARSLSALLLLLRRI